jgi:hypothetical protein
MRFENSGCRLQHVVSHCVREVAPQIRQFDRLTALARGGTRFATRAMIFLLEVLAMLASATAPAPIVRKRLFL